MDQTQSLQDKISQGSELAGVYFQQMAKFVGFDKRQAEHVRESRFIIEKHIPDIVAQFYDHLLRYPPTRKVFLDEQGNLKIDYVQLRMQHLTNFWRRTASGPYDDDYARYIDYVGRSHTRRGADPNIDIAERFVIGQVGFIQHAISEAISAELHDLDPAWETRSLKAWNLLMIVILELLARAYHDEDEFEVPGAYAKVDYQEVQSLAVDAYEQGLGMHQFFEIKHPFFVANEEDIPLGQRIIIDVFGKSIGVFHHKSGWYAIRNSCLHAGGPVATGRLRGDVITCPWHGFQYYLPTGVMVKDSAGKLETYPVELIAGQVFIKVSVKPELIPNIDEGKEETTMAENEFKLSDIPSGEVGTVEVGGETVAVFNIGGSYFAIEDYCPHAGAPLSEGRREENVVTCPWHGSIFNVQSGEVVQGPAREAVRTYKVSIAGDIGRVEE